VGFLTDFGFLINVKPIFNSFYPFLGVIGQFWRLTSWRKLEMRNYLPNYITKACLRPQDNIEGIQSRIMLKRSQAKAILRQIRF
jgi:hypothetical protein